MKYEISEQKMAEDDKRIREYREKREKMNSLSQEWVRNFNEKKKNRVPCPPLPLAD